jgi:hypothetical protein
MWLYVAVRESVTAVQRYDIEGSNGSGCLAVCYGYGFTVNGEKNAETNLVEMCPKGAE